MANLAYKKFYTNGDYVNIAEEMNITFTSGNSYQIQVENASRICEADTKPTQGGFYTNNEPFTYKHTGSKLWVASGPNNRPVVVNIAE